MSKSDNFPDIELDQVAFDEFHEYCLISGYDPAELLRVFMQSMVMFGVEQMNFPVMVDDTGKVKVCVTELAAT
jgi:hypothetical protein